MFRFPAFNRFLKAVVATLTTAYVLVVLAEGWAGVPIAGLLALRADDPGLWTLWQVFTYPFVFDPSPHGFGGFLITLLFTYWIYGDFQANFGTRRAIQLAVVVTISCAAAALVAGPISGSPDALLGFGLINWGALGCVAWLAKGKPIQLFGVVPLKGGEQLLMLLAALAILSFLPTKSVVNLVAQLTALGAGVAFSRFMTTGLGPRRPRKSKKKPFDVIPGGRDRNGGQRWLN